MTTTPAEPTQSGEFNEIVQHIWFKPTFLVYDCCRKCGIVRRADDKNSPCKGKVALRDFYTEGQPQ